VGQVLFPSQALSQVQNLIDAGCLFRANATSEEKREAVFDVVKSNFQTYRFDRARPFTIVHSTRELEGMEAMFRICTLSWNGRKWQEATLPVPSTSAIMGAWGSGEAAIERWHKRWMNTRQGGRTSRSVFSAFCDALASGEDQFTGGAPQLVGLYRKDRGVIFGVIYGGTRYFLGLPISDQAPLLNVEWRNSLFERCDGQTMNRLDGAQQHRHPQGLGKAL
jgi:hypothetical protein